MTSSSSRRPTATAPPTRMRPLSCLAVSTRRPKKGGRARTGRRCSAALVALAFAPVNAHAHTAYSFDLSFGTSRLQAPVGLAVDPSDGEVFVSDTRGILAFNATG